MNQRKLSKVRARRKRFVLARNVKNNNMPRSQVRGVVITQKFADKIYAKSQANLKAKAKAIKAGRVIVKTGDK